MGSLHAEKNCCNMGKNVIPDEGQEILTSVSKANNFVRFTLEFTYQKIKISLLTEKMDEVWINCSYWVRKQDVR